MTFDYGAKGIRVNSICPGATLTGMTPKPEEGDSLPNVAEELSKFPAQRFCQPWEIAKLAVYLASDDSDFIHGAAVVIDGGWLTAARDPF